MEWKAGDEVIVVIPASLLRRALHAERMRGDRRHHQHWTYDVNRCISLAETLQDEIKLLEGNSHG